MNHGDNPWNQWRYNEFLGFMARKHAAFLYYHAKESLERKALWERAQGIMARKNPAKRKVTEKQVALPAPPVSYPTPIVDNSNAIAETFRQQYGTHTCPECSIPFNPNDANSQPIQEGCCKHVKCRRCFIYNNSGGCSQCPSKNFKSGGLPGLTPDFSSNINGCTKLTLTATHNGGIVNTRGMVSDPERPTVDYGAIHALTAPIYSGNLPNHINSTNNRLLPAYQTLDYPINQQGTSSSSLLHAQLTNGEGNGNSHIYESDSLIVSRVNSTNRKRTHDASQTYIKSKTSRVSTDGPPNFPIESGSLSNLPSTSTSTPKSTHRFFSEDSQRREQKKNSAIASVQFNANAGKARTRNSEANRKCAPQDLPSTSPKSFPPKNGINVRLAIAATENKTSSPALPFIQKGNPGVPQHSPPLALPLSKPRLTYGKARSLEAKERSHRINGTLFSTAAPSSSSSISLLENSSSSSAPIPIQNLSPIVPSLVDPPQDPLNGGFSSDEQEGGDLEDSNAEPSAKGKKKRNPVNILDHISVISGDPPQYQCNVCQKKFKTKAHIKYHEFCQKGEKPFKCEQCGQGFIAKSHYEYHLRTHTGERPYTCPKCGKGFNQRGKVTRHMRSHTGEKPFVCQQCGRGFANAQAMRSHFLIHTGERPFACEYCDKRFTGMTNLKKHVITHTGERPFMCTHCGKSFGLKWTLDLHLRTHSSERPFACDQCTRAFSNSKDLRRHMVIHSGERPFKCWICETSFRRKDNLDRHIKNTHNQPKEVAKQLANEAAAAYLAETKAKQLQSQNAQGAPSQQRAIASTSGSNFIIPSASSSVQLVLPSTSSASIPKVNKAGNKPSDKKATQVKKTEQPSKSVPKVSPKAKRSGSPAKAPVAKKPKKKNAEKIVKETNPKPTILIAQVSSPPAAIYSCTLELHQSPEWSELGKSTKESRNIKENTVIITAVMSPTPEQNSEVSEDSGVDEKPDIGESTDDQSSSIMSESHCLALVPDICDNTPPHPHLDLENVKVEESEVKPEEENNTEDDETFRETVTVNEKLVEEKRSDPAAKPNEIVQVSKPVTRLSTSSDENTDNKESRKKSRDPNFAQTVARESTGISYDDSGRGSLGQDATLLSDSYDISDDEVNSILDIPKENLFCFAILPDPDFNVIDQIYSIDKTYVKASNFSNSILSSGEERITTNLPESFSERNGVPADKHDSLPENRATVDSQEADGKNGISDILNPVQKQNQLVKVKLNIPIPHDDGDLDLVSDGDLSDDEPEADTISVQSLKDEEEDEVENVSVSSMIESISNTEVDVKQDQSVDFVIKSPEKADSSSEIVESIPNTDADVREDQSVGFDIKSPEKAESSLEIVESIPNTDVDVKDDQSTDFEIKSPENAESSLEILESIPNTEVDLIEDQSADFDIKSPEKADPSLEIVESIPKTEVDLKSLENVESSLEIVESVPNTEVDLKSPENVESSLEIVESVPNTEVDLKSPENVESSLEIVESVPNTEVDLKFPENVESSLEIVESVPNTEVDLKSPENVESSLEIVESVPNTEVDLKSPENVESSLEIVESVPNTEVDVKEDQSADFDIKSPENAESSLKIVESFPKTDLKSPEEAKSSLEMIESIPNTEVDVKEDQSADFDIKSPEEAKSSLEMIESIPDTEVDLIEDQSAEFDIKSPEEAKSSLEIVESIPKADVDVVEDQSADFDINSPENAESTSEIVESIQKAEVDVIEDQSADFDIKSPDNVESSLKIVESIPKAEVDVIEDQSAEFDIKSLEKPESSLEIVESIPKTDVDLKSPEKAEPSLEILESIPNTEVDLKEDQSAYFDIKSLEKADSFLEIVESIPNTEVDVKQDQTADFDIKSPENAESTLEIVESIPNTEVDIKDDQFTDFDIKSPENAESPLETVESNPKTEVDLKSPENVESSLEIVESIPNTEVDPIEEQSADFDVKSPENAESSLKIVESIPTTGVDLKSPENADSSLEIAESIPSTKVDLEFPENEDSYLEIVESIPNTEVDLIEDQSADFDIKCPENAESSLKIVESFPKTDLKSPENADSSLEIVESIPNTEADLVEDQSNDFDIKSPENVESTLEIVESIPITEVDVKDDQSANFEIKSPENAESTLEIVESVPNTEVDLIEEPTDFVIKSLSEIVESIAKTEGDVQDEQSADFATKSIPTISEPMDYSTSSSSLEISFDPPVTANIHFVYSNPHDSEFAQPTIPGMEDSNLRIVYAAAAAQAEGSDEETGAPSQVRLLYAEALGYGGDGTGPPQFVYTATTPNQTIRSIDQDIMALRPRYISMPPGWMSHERVQAMMAEQPPTYPSRLPVRVITAGSGATFSQSFADYPENYNLVELAGRVPNLIPQEHIDQQREFSQIFAAHGLYENSEIDSNPSAVPDQYLRDMPRNSTASPSSFSPQEEGLHCLAEAATYVGTYGYSKEAIEAAKAISAVGNIARKLREIEIKKHRN